MKTPASNASKGRARSKNKDKDDDYIDDDDDDDEESLGRIRSPNKSPEHRISPNKNVNELSDKLMYDDYVDSEEFFRSVVKNHQKHDNSTGVLFCMALGFPEYDRMLENPPFSETRKKQYTKHFRPSNQMMMHEVQRRAFFIAELGEQDATNPFMRHGKIVLPKPAQWSREKLIKWLKENLLEWKLSDMAYMQHHINAYKRLLIKTLNQKKYKLQQDETIWARAGWDGIIPNIRLINIVTSDELKESFVHRNDMVSRLE